MRRLSHVPARQEDLARNSRSSIGGPGSEVLNEEEIVAVKSHLYRYFAVQARAAPKASSRGQTIMTHIYTARDCGAVRPVFVAPVMKPGVLRKAVRESSISASCPAVRGAHPAASQPQNGHSCSSGTAP